ncbi:helix-turn-helix domain-containing protein [Runella zeae]|uniref:helix-turn-helix domain-containing protein n=1 Tax=Runella zeae TaxID=94255 RepID=UPI002357AD8A|nr:AraC family transcriptional regulator [Runella zeae]
MDNANPRLAFHQNQNPYYDPIVVNREVVEAHSSLNCIPIFEGFYLHCPLAAIQISKKDICLVIDNVFCSAADTDLWTIDSVPISLISIAVPWEWAYTRYPLEVFYSIREKLSLELTLTTLSFSRQDLHNLLNISFLQDSLCDKGLAKKQMIGSLLDGFFADYLPELFFTRKNVVVEASTQDDEKLVQLYDKYIAQPLIKLPSLEDIADEAGMSVSKLNKAFKAKYGRPVFECHTEIKLNYALDLLQNGYKVEDVSKLLGYSQPIKFINVFKRWFHITPGKVKKNVSSDSE